MAIELGDGIIRIDGDTDQFRRSMKNAARVAGLAMTAAGAAIVGGLTSAVRAASDFESAFAGVRKTVDATEDEFQDMRKAFLDMSTEIPVTANELAGIAEIAGQLGVDKKNIVAFTRTIADLGVSSNLAGEEGALMLAQFINVADIGQDEIRNLGSAFVALGNNAATTEKDIAMMASRVVGAGTLAEFSAGDILGLSAAVSSVGVQAQVGGTSLSRMIAHIHSAVLDGGDDLKQLATIAGVTAEEFKVAYEERAVSGIVSFIEGLARIREEGGDVAATIAQLGFKGSQMGRVFGATTLAVDLLKESIKLGNESFKDNTALTEEAEKRYATFESQLQLFKNTLTVLRVEIGTVLLPVLREWLIKGKGLLLAGIEWVRNNKELTLTIAKVSGVVGALLLVLGPLLVVLPAIVTALAAVGAKAILVGAAIAGGLTVAFVTLRPILEQAVQWVRDNWDQIVRIFTTAGKLVVQAMKILRQALKLVVGTILAVLKGLWGGFTEAFEGMFADVDFNSMSTLDTIEWFLNGVLTFVTKVTGYLTRFVTWWSGAWSTITSIVQTAYSTLLGPLSWLLQAVQKVAGFVGFGGGGGGYGGGPQQYGYAGGGGGYGYGLGDGLSGGGGMTFNNVVNVNGPQYQDMTSFAGAISREQSKDFASTMHQRGHNPAGLRS